MTGAHKHHGKAKAKIAQRRPIAPAAPVAPPAPARGARLCRRVGLVLLLLAACTSAFLVYQHFGGHIPGCGPQAGCAKLQNSVYSKVPWVGWPVAFVGLAYFLAMAAGLASDAGWRRSPLRWVAWQGAAASLGFIGLMVHLGEFCAYCAATHAFNLAFLGVMEWSIRLGANRTGKEVAKMGSVMWRGVGVFVTVFVVSNVGLGIAYAANLARMASNAELDREKSTAEIIKRSGTAESEQPVDRWGSNGFTGRWRQGPEQAAIRVVVLTDYQCPDCLRVEGEIEEVMKSRTDMSLSVKHFPMCVECNKYTTVNMHENACWAARAAEAAGILGGDEAFFKMHDWLFEVRGRFITAQDLAVGIGKTGLDAAAFNGVLSSAQTLKNVQADVEDGIALGLYTTPMVFINGVEFKGWQVAGAFRKTVEQVAATKPSPRTSAADRPALAPQRYVDDWKESPVMPRTEDKTAWSMGLKAGESPAGGAPAVEIVVFGDYQEESTIKLDAQILEAMKGRTNVRYTFRHYPVDPSCNAALPAGVPAASIHPLACKAAKAAEAAGAVGGNDAYWKMHQWLMDNWKTLSDAGIEKAAKDFELDVEKFKAQLQAPAVAAAIGEDCQAGKAVGLSRIPYVLVNNRVVPRVLRDGDNIMKRIVEEGSR